MKGILKFFKVQYLVFFVLSFQLCFASPKNFPTEEPVRFIFIGDSGTGGRGQYKVADAIRNVCKERGCQFAIDAGDNIYERGVKSSVDQQFQDKFEKPYQNLSFPFFMALGNHDQSGVVPGSGVHPDHGDYEVQYSSHSDKWVMPARYYQFSVPFGKANQFNSVSAHPIIDFFVMDTNLYAPQNQPPFQWYKPGEKYDLEQQTWLTKRIATSNATWKVAVGHHPYRNHGTQGNAGQFVGIGLSKGEALKKLVEKNFCNRIDFLFAGHDHSLQWLPAYPQCGSKPEFLISGASAKFYDLSRSASSKKYDPAVWESFNALGFFWIEVTPTQMKIVAYTINKKGLPEVGIDRTVLKAVGKL